MSYALNIIYRQNQDKMITKKKLRYLINDERKASKEYRKLGFPNLAKDESKHRRFLVKKLKAKLKGER